MQALFQSRLFYAFFFPLTQLTSLHYFLIYAISFSG